MIRNQEDRGASASPKPALVASLPEPVPVSAHSGDGQARGLPERLRFMADVGDMGRKPDPTSTLRLAAKRIDALEKALTRLAELTPARANAPTAIDLYLTVRAIAESALEAQP